MNQNISPELYELRKRIRHSAAHVMADVTTKMFPEAKLAIGPPTDDGFYYDFLTDAPFTDDDLEKIENEMRKVIKTDLQFKYSEYTKEEALQLNTEEPLKTEIIEGIPVEETISTYRHGDFEDLCAGPHVESTGKIPAFKLLNVAGAYWRGDEKKPMLQRIYGTAFESNKSLKQHLYRLSEAKKRDHRLLGKQLDLFSINDQVGAGLVIWHPKGALIRTIIEDFWKTFHRKNGYELVYSPHIGKSNLWETSGHLEFFKDNMFSKIEMDGQDYYLKPMNCPFHITYYKSGLKSYRELPLRIGELGTVYRYERGGVLHGLSRVRGMTQDDAHIFCRQDQVKDEINKVLDLTIEMLSYFGLTEYQLNLSTRPDKAVGDDNQWEIAISALKETLEERNIEYGVDDGGGAFYGPKIDLNIKDALGRAWQCTTIQFDFNLPERFDLKYIGEDGTDHKPYMVHRTILGTMERFVSILIEHYAGALPPWLCPVQVMIIPIADSHHEYAKKVHKVLEESNIRVESDLRNERMNSKIRNGQLNKIPYMIILGDKEVESGTISIRSRDAKDTPPATITDFLSKIKVECVGPE